mmetsp:Transcript_5062/g.2837  ORF Transcript_5062/g.2837 Transcript_5062/m.2837 type:complete len:126 (+) Transcript_5062:4834-5211(+)
MITRNQKYGQESEVLAVTYLKKNDYKILKQNFRTKFGEIDIIAKDKNVLVFVEVKARKSLDYGKPKHSVTFNKQKKISKVALFYLKDTKQMNVKARFDIVSIISTSNYKKPELKIIKNAFELAYK